MPPTTPTPADWADAPVTDADRQRVVARLCRVAGVDGFDLDDFEQRVTEVWQVHRMGDLERVAARAPAPPPPPIPREVVVAAMGARRRGGGWQPAPLTSVVAAFGNVRLDLTEASWDGRPLTVDAVAVCGGVEVLVPSGVEVRCEGTVAVAGRRAAGEASGSRPLAPRVHVVARALLGHVSVRRHPFRSWIPAA